MRIFAVEAEDAIGAQLATQLIDHGHQVVGTHGSPRDAGRGRGLSAEPAALGQPRVRAAPHRGGVLMPVGYLWTVAAVSWGVACALTRWPRLGTFAALPALVVSELPFLVGYFLIASTVLALADGDLGSPAGAAAAVVALLALAGLVVIVRRALRAHAALRNAGRPSRPWGRILRAPFFPAGRRGPGTRPGLRRRGRTARWTYITAASRPALRSCCTSMAAASTPATRPAKRGRSSGT